MEAAVDCVLIALAVMGIAYGIHRLVKNSDGDDDELPWTMKIWVFPLLVVLVLVPVGVMAAVVAGVLWGAGRYGRLFTVENAPALWASALYILLAFLFYDLVLEKVIHGFFRLLVKRPLNWVEREVSGILGGAVIFYLFGTTIPGAHIKNFPAALSLSVLVAMIGWVIEGIQRLVAKWKRPPA